jgi:hypothetical protein
MLSNDRKLISFLFTMKVKKMPEGLFLYGKEEKGKSTFSTFVEKKYLF